MSNFTDAKTPFELPSMSVEGNMVMGRFNCYLLYNESVFELNPKSGAVFAFEGLRQKSIVRLVAGRAHYMAYERTEPLANNWKT